MHVIVQDCTMQAEMNKKFLSILKEPCEELLQLKPREIPSKLKHIISLIRIIWNNCPYYYSNERITRLFCQVHGSLFLYTCEVGCSIQMTFFSFLLLIPSHTHQLELLLVNPHSHHYLHFVS